MANIAMQTEPDFDIDIKEDVEEECSKYGRLLIGYSCRETLVFTLFFIVRC